MNKYAYIENVPDLSVDHYMDTFDDGVEWISHVAGFNGMDVCMDYARKLIAEGYSIINLCGDFGEEHVKELLKNAPEGTEVHYAAYLPQELAKLEALKQYIEYGMIIFGNVEDPVRLELTAPEMNTHTVFIADLEQAKEVAKQFAEDGVDGIELCSSFDLDMTKEIISVVEAIDKNIPVGSNGIAL